MIMVNKSRCVCIVLVMLIVASILCVPAYAYEKDNTSVFTVDARRASGRINIKVSAGKIGKASTSFPLEKGDIVEIKASYAPANVSFNVGLIAPDGQFYYDTVSDGKIDEKIEVSQHGYYTLTIENTSDFDVTINGYVNY